MAGRIEDAFSLTWEKVEFRSGGGGFAYLEKGKTEGRRTVFSPRTANLLEE